MTLLPFTTDSLEGDLVAVLEKIPTRGGVGQILGPDGRNLLIGRAANLRRWAASHLGAAKPRREGSRPPTDLRPVATAVAVAVTTSSFQQRLLFERLMSRYVPPSARRDLRPPTYLHLDPSERFPRVTIRKAGDDRARLFGPFRDRRTAGRVINALHNLFPLRPCDYVFEPHPALPLGINCLYAQVRSCAAPCLVRVSEEAYRALAMEAASYLASPRARSGEAGPWLPTWVARAEAVGLVIERGREGIELYPVRAGTVLEEGSVTADECDLESALESLHWPVPDPARDDSRWFSAWLHLPRRSGRYLVLEEGKPADPGPLLARIRESLEDRGHDSSGGQERGVVT